MRERYSNNRFVMAWTATMATVAAYYAAPVDHVGQFGGLVLAIVVFLVAGALLGWDPLP